LVQEEISKSPLQEEATQSSGLVEDGTKCPNDKDQHPSLSPNTTCPAKSPNTVCPIKALEVEDPSWLVDNNRLRSLGMVCRTTKTPSLTMYYIFRYFMLC